jgi:hypothetical protein
MGSWNKTCGLSNLHIRAGDPVYVFVLEKDSEKATTRSDFCYATAFYRPLLLPFHSVYNDYGGGEKSSGPAFELIMDQIKDALVEIPLGENEYHDIAVTKEKFGEELFFDAVHEDRLRIKASQFHSESSLYFVMFRLDIVNHILDNWQREEYVGKGLGTCGWDNSYIRYGFNDIQNDLLEFLDRMSIYPNKVAKWLRFDDYRYSRLVNIKELIVKYITEDRRGELYTLLSEYLKGVYIDGFMHMTRKSWIPGGHEGSQSQEHHGYRVLIDAMTKALDAERKEVEEFNGEEFSDF